MDSYQHSLTSNSLFVGKVAIRLKAVDSTNKYATNLLSKSSPSEGTAIYADKQRAGRGQIGSTWVSEPEQNITLSIILYPKFLEASAQFWLNRAVSLGIRDFLRLHVPDTEQVWIKWPNDLYVNDQKLGGILIENRLAYRQIATSIVGIGLNINQTDFPSHLPNPSSLRLITQQRYDLQQLLGELCECLEKRYLQLRNKRLESLKQDYLGALYLYRQPADFRITETGEQIRGQIVGIGEQGHLLIETTQKSYAFSLKEVKFLLPNPKSS